TLATEAEWYGFNNWIAESKKYIASGHAANRKVICMLGGAGSNNDSIWNKATAVGTVNTFSRNITGFLKSIGFDGASLDWENEVEFPSFIRFAKSLRAEWPDAYIDVPAGFNGDDAADFAPMKDAVDSFTPMSYMAVPQWGGWLLPVPVTPLHSAGSNHYGADVLLQRWTNAGVPASKVLLGIGGFGAVWGDANKDGLAPVRLYVNSGYPNGETGPLEGDNVVTWSFVRSVLKSTTVMNEGWDELSQTAYWTTGDSTKQAAVPYPGRSYDMNISLMFCETGRSMSRKMEYVETNGMLGFSVWTLSQLMENGKSGPVLDVASLLKFSSVTDVRNEGNGTNSVPMQFTLSQNYPNPFNPATTLSYTLINDGAVTLKIFNALGQEVATLVNAVQRAGEYHHVTFNADRLASGVYFARLQSGGNIQLKKMLLMK
ncbi:MAG: T9SS type A sorting domain-containing protein, partial [Bacteroidetes bacterium]|nr:T9SS type A sorting domain-containing protein [Bacteroidota bacterium]